MTEEDLEMVRQAIVDHAAPAAQAILQSLEAKLSPKYAPKGRLCEVWDVKSNGEHFRHEIAVSCGDGTYTDFFDGDSSNGIPVDHFREILTAQDALDALRDDHRSFLVSPGAIQDLINNAQEV